MNKSAAPQIISLSTAELEKLLGELRGPLAPATYQLVEALLRTLQWVMAALEQKTATSSEECASILACLRNRSTCSLCLRR